MYRQTRDQSKADFKKIQREYNVMLSALHKMDTKHDTIQP